MLTWWRRWSPRRTARVDSDRTHSYRSTAWPSGLPEFPIACYLADRAGIYRLLAFDFDVGRYGSDAVEVDCSILAKVLDDLDVPHLIVRSGPSGGVHIWVRLCDKGVEAPLVAGVGRALRAHLPTLDISPLSNPQTGAVRIPGSPHRLNGSATPLLTGADLDRALQEMDRNPAPPELIAWLHARFPTQTRRDSRAGDPGPAHIGFTGAGSNQRLNRARTALSPQTMTLLHAPLPPSADRSAIAWAICLGMAASGWCWNDVAKELNQPGLTRLRQDHRQHEVHAINQWHKALMTAARTAWPRAALDRPDRDPITDLIARASQSMFAHPNHWARPGFTSAQRVLSAFLNICTAAHTEVINVDVRRLAESSNVHAATASRALHRLEGEGWISRVDKAEGTSAATWRLNEPPLHTAATQVVTRPPGQHLPTRLSHAQQDIWVWGGGLGGCAEAIHLSWENGSRTAVQLREDTGYSLATITRWLARLQGLGLLSSRPAWRTAARVLGVDGVMLARVHRHRCERLVRDWWNQELAWRRLRGKRRKRGPRAVDTSPNAPSLPIAVPARMRYGRFPTKPGGRMAYANALTHVEMHDRHRVVA